MSVDLNELVSDITIGMAAQESGKAEEAAEALPVGTGVNIGHIDSESTEQRLAAAQSLIDAGLTPISHIAARRMSSQSALQNFLARRRKMGNPGGVFVVGGDPATPAGPYAQALDVIESEILQEHGVARVSIGGYPEGHPAIGETERWDALERKAELLDQSNMAGDIISQITVDTDATLLWIEQLRERGITMPVRVGIPGPVRAGSLIEMASQYGSAVNGRIAQRLQLERIPQQQVVRADALVDDLAENINPAAHGVVRLHVFSFGALPATARWMRGLHGVDSY